MSTGQRYIVGDKDRRKIAALTILLLALIKNTPSGQLRELRASLVALSGNKNIVGEVSPGDALKEAEALLAFLS